VIVRSPDSIGVVVGVVDTNLKCNGYKQSQARCHRVERPRIPRRGRTKKDWPESQGKGSKPGAAHPTGESRGWSGMFH
jgi:hypothetical protein